MIFITVGTANKGFDRLIEKCDEIAKKHTIDFFAQTGSSEYTPLNMRYKQWLSAEEIQTQYLNASAFIVHGGFGTISEVLRLGKPIIVVPRLFDKGEAVNDQSDISIKLDKLGYVSCIIDLNMLENSLLNINHLNLKAYTQVSDIPFILFEKINQLKDGMNKTL